MVNCSICKTDGVSAVGLLNKWIDCHLCVCKLIALALFFTLYIIQFDIRVDER